MDLPLLLLVDDDPIVREIMAMTLDDAGFHVLMASNGTEAMTALQENTARVRAIITDINLGAEPDGWEVARSVRTMISNLPVIYVSGGAAHDWPSKGVPKSVVLAKPFSPAQLTTAVSMLLVEADTMCGHRVIAMGASSTHTAAVRAPSPGG
jgi:CheY-like chemotaxis protein